MRDAERMQAEDEAMAMAAEARGYVTRFVESVLRTAQGALDSNQGTASDASEDGEQGTQGSQHEVGQTQARGGDRKGGDRKAAQGEAAAAAEEEEEEEEESEDRAQSNGRAPWGGLGVEDAEMIAAR